MEQTIAAKIADALDNDGMNIHDLDSLCKSTGCKVIKGASKGCYYTVYEFADKSAIVEMCGRWDIRASGCSGHCWEGQGCQCADAE